MFLWKKNKKSEKIGTIILAYNTGFSNVIFNFYDNLTTTYKYKINQKAN